MSEPRFGVTFIDKRKSKINEKKSKPDDGFFVFDKEVKFEQKPKKRGEVPDFVYKWIHTSPTSIYTWQSKYGAMIVGKDDDVYPKPLSLNADGAYQAGRDLILVKIPIDVWMKKREREVMASHRAAKKSYDVFEKKVKSKTGGALGDASLTDAEKERIGL